MNPPNEPTPDQELSNVMKQIAAMESGQLDRALSINLESQALSGAPASPASPAALVTQEAATTPNAPAASEVQPPSDPAPETQPARSTPVPVRTVATPNDIGDDPKPHDVVQVNDRDSKYHGTFFAIGAIADGLVHGYRLTEHNGKEYITVKIHEVHRIGGPAKVCSRIPCSRQWIEQHGRKL